MSTVFDLRFPSGRRAPRKTGALVVVELHMLAGYALLPVVAPAPPPEPAPVIVAPIEAPAGLTRIGFVTDSHHAP